MSQRSRSRIKQSFVVTIVLIALTLGLATMAQVRQVDQGRAGTTTAQVWLVKICDASGTNCGTFAVPVTITGTIPVTVTGTMTVTGTVQNNGGTVTATPTGTTTITGTVSATSGTINSLPTISVTSGTIGQLPTVSVTSGTVGQITMPSLTVTSGTINSSTISSIPAITQTSGTVNSATISQMPTLSVTSGTIGSLPSVSVTSGTIGLITMPTLSVTSGTIGSMPSLSVTSGTIGSITMPSLTFTSGTITNGTAAPVVDGGRSSNDTTGSVANGSAVALRLDKWGDVVTALAPFDLMGFGTTSVTATTAAQILASSGGANYRWAITSIMACNLSGVVATQMNLLDSAGTLMSFPWTQTATTAGEARCYMQQFPTPYYSAANTTMSVQLTVSNATGVRANITAFKTGT